MTEQTQKPETRQQLPPLSPDKGSLTFHDRIINGDALTELAKIPSGIFNMCVTSPPYWMLRDYNVEGQLGLEPTFQEYITKLCDIFDEVKRVLKKEGTCWVNMGDTYNNNSQTNKFGKTSKVVRSGYNGSILATSKKMQNIQDKCLLQIPSRFAIEMCNRGWILRNEIIWHKPNCMPSSVKDRFTVDFEKIFFFTKSKKYYFETQYEPVKEISIKRAEYGWDCDRPSTQSNGGVHTEKMGERFVNPQGRNKRCVWRIPTKPSKEAHYAAYPIKLIMPCILAGCPEGGIILDPFIGSGTTAIAALNSGRNFIGIELNQEYVEMANKRIEKYLNQLNLFQNAC